MSQDPLHVSFQKYLDSWSNPKTTISFEVYVERNIDFILQHFNRHNNQECANWYNKFVIYAKKRKTRVVSISGHQ